MGKLNFEVNVDFERTFDDYKRNSYRTSALQRRNEKIGAYHPNDFDGRFLQDMARQIEVYNQANTDVAEDAAFFFLVRNFEKNAEFIEYVLGIAKAKKGWVE